MSYFTDEDTLFSITERFPETIPVFASNGFPQMADEKKREAFARTISLKTALMLKQMDLQIFTKMLSDSIDQGVSGADSTLAAESDKADVDAVNLVGLLPCPVRLPLLEQFNRFSDSYTRDTGVSINHELKAASMGLEWVEENIRGVTDSSDLPDLFISAGFDMFFDREMIGRFKNDGVFEDLTGISDVNPLFSSLDLRDPMNHYSMIGVVPAVFLVNTEELAGRSVPRTWEELIQGDFEKRVSLPVGDFDLFNGILLNIHKRYGDEGVRKLGRTLLESMHPSQMVKSNRKTEDRPVVTIMPYFFTKMVKEGGSLVAVWPDDGAIISPIFMLSKKERAESVKPIVDFFASRQVGEILSHSGLFPSLHPEVDNRIDSDRDFMWLGWDYIYGHDISALISHCEELFNSSVQEEL